MPSNIDKPKQDTNIWLEKALTKDLANMAEGMPVGEIVRQVTLLYPVSSLYVKKRIKECYIDLGYIKEQDNILFTLERK